MGVVMGVAEWYFRVGVEVSGPFDLETMHGFRRAGLIKAESEVSLLSIPGRWIAARETEIFREPPSPPAASKATPTSDHISSACPDDRFAWSLAVAALAISIFEAQSFRLGIAPFYDEWFSSWGWLFYLFVNGTLANADIRRNRSFLSDRQLALVLLVPAYFWVRQRQTKQSTMLLFANLAAIALSAAVTFGKVPIVGGMNISSCYASENAAIVKKLAKQIPVMMLTSVDVLRSISEVSYDGKNRVCSGEVLTGSNMIYRIEFSIELRAGDDREYVRMRITH